MAIQNKDIIDKLTIEEKASLCSGKDYWNTKAIPRMGIKSIMVADGPHGLRKRDYKEKKKRKGADKRSVLAGKPAICYPTAATTACSWDEDLLYKMGQALGIECQNEGVSVLLGPGVNIKRSPLCGRNFEYFSEDPLLAGKLAAAFIKGVQSKGIGTSLKHFAVNNQETRRMTINAVVDKRTLMEIYLRPFEIAVKEAQPWTIMCAYNRLNGTYCSENKWLLTDVLRDKWGFEGLVVTDWGAENNRVDGLAAGQELEMPFSGGKNDKKIAEAVRKGVLPEEILNNATDKVINLSRKGGTEKERYEEKEHHQLAREIAARSMVLLKNEDDILPLEKQSAILVVGEMAENPRYQGAGSSLLNPTKLENVLGALQEKNVAYKYVHGYSLNKKDRKKDREYLMEAVEAARSAETVLVFAGLPSEYETEGYDRTGIEMPESHNQLIEELSKVNQKVVVVLSGGSVMQMRWSDDVAGILLGGLSGQAGGAAVVDVLFGDVNPEGRLAETYPFETDDVPCAKYFPGDTTTSEYRESLFVGYRYYDTVNKAVLYPFGYGLSYTQFEYEPVKISSSVIRDDECVTVEVPIKNIGTVSGAEVVQVYVSDLQSTVFRPKKELKGFQKVFLEPGETKKVQIELDKDAFSFYNPIDDEWQVESGEFRVSVGASVEDIKTEVPIRVESSSTVEALDLRNKAPSYYTGEITNLLDEEFEAVLGTKLPTTQSRKRLLDYSNTLEDAMGGKWGRRFNKMIFSFLDPGSMAGAVAVQSPIKTFIYWSMGVFSEDMADGLLLILNEDRFFRGLGKILRGVPGAIKKMPALFRAI